MTGIRRLCGCYLDPLQDLPYTGGGQPFTHRYLSETQPLTSQCRDACSSRRVTNGAAEAFAFCSRVGESSPHALNNDLAFKLREGTYHVEKQAAHSAGCINALGVADEIDAEYVELSE